MRRFIWLGVLVLLAAAGAGVAYAHGRDPGKSLGRFGNPGITDVSATASLAYGTTNTSTCAGVDGTYALTRFTATGSIASGALAGNVTASFRWLMNNTKNDGVASGQLVIRNADNTVRAVGRFEGAIEGKTLSGIIEGKYANGNTAGQLLGSFQAVRNGSVTIRIGNVTQPGAAVVWGGTGCASTGTTTVTTTATTASSAAKGKGKK
jgi:hypothetical protein